jgi:hypothetical protein
MKTPSVASATALVAALLSLAPTVQAGTECDRWFGCGYVYNSSPWELRVTKVEAEGEATDQRTEGEIKRTPDRCAFDNWNKAPWDRAETVWCKQIAVPSGTESGDSNDHDDVDGLTFNGRKWYFNGDEKEDGRWQKIWDGTRVHCWDKDGKAWCEDGYDGAGAKRRSLLTRGRTM